MIRRFAPMALLAFAPACQQAKDQPGENAARDLPKPTDYPIFADAPAVTPSSVPGDHTPTRPRTMTLTALADDDASVITGAMANVGGCQFVDAGKRTLLSVGLPDSNTASGIGVARVDQRRAKLITAVGGRTAIENGPTLRFEGVTLKVDHKDGEGDKVGIETRAWPATLTVTDADGARAAYTGTWSCGV